MFKIAWSIMGPSVEGTQGMSGMKVRDEAEERERDHIAEGLHC